MRREFKFLLHLFSGYSTGRPEVDGAEDVPGVKMLEGTALLHLQYVFYKCITSHRHSVFYGITAVLVFVYQLLINRKCH